MKLMTFFEVGVFKPPRDVYSKSRRASASPELLDLTLAIIGHVTEDSGDNLIIPFR